MGRTIPAITELSMLPKLSFARVDRSSSFVCLRKYFSNVIRTGRTNTYKLTDTSPRSYSRFHNGSSVRDPWIQPWKVYIESISRPCKFHRYLKDARHPMNDTSFRLVLHGTPCNNSERNETHHRTHQFNGRYQFAGTDAGRRADPSNNSVMNVGIQQHFHIGAHYQVLFIFYSAKFLDFVFLRRVTCRDMIQYV